MKIKVYADEETRKIIEKKRKEAQGHCPCVIPSQWNDDNICICKDFKEAPVGTVCHCGLYKKLAF